MNLAELKHAIEPLPSGGLVLVLDTGAMLKPETTAMLMAMYSRDPGTVLTRLEKIAEKGPEKFMGGFYVGYGHKSIGDCASTDIYIEGISMLAAKAIQDSMLYNGQECSTRYIDFSTVRFEDPVGTEESRYVLERWRKFYVDSMPEVVGHLKMQFPRGNGEDEKVWEKAINARAFDILRGFLPAGATTSVGWHTELRHAADRLVHLRHHELSEVRLIADALEKALGKAHPSSFGHKKYPATEEYMAIWGANRYFRKAVGTFWSNSSKVDWEMLKKFEHEIAHRPAKTELPKRIAAAGTWTFEFLLDFGSFRDIQRQRAVIQEMPLLTMNLGFEQWYLAELPEEVRHEARKLLANQQLAMEEFKMSPEVLQYYIPMGYKVANRLTGDLSALVYLVELRATRFVHPTLVRRAIQMADALVDSVKTRADIDLVLHLDKEPGRFDIKRGTHDIVKKEPA